MASSSLHLRRVIRTLSIIHRSFSSPYSSSSPPLFRHAISSSSSPSPLFSTLLPPHSRPFTSSPISLLSSRSPSSSDFSDEIGSDTILFEGCDYNHWLIVMDFPKDNKPSPQQMVETYEQTCAQGLNISVEDAKKKIYACSTTTYTGFQVVMTEEESNKFEGLPGVIFVLPDTYIDPVNKEYGGDKYINGTIIPRPPPIQKARNQGRRNFNMRPRDLNKEKKTLNWTRAMDDYLVDAFIEQYNRGNKVKGTFTPFAYENIVKEMSALLDVDIDKEKIKNRWKTLKKNFGEVFDIFKNGLSGFVWNPSTQIWEAEDQVWDQLIESKPKAAMWRNNPFPNYDKMVILYGADRAGGEKTYTTNEMQRRSQTIIEEVFTNVANDISHGTTQHGVPSQQNEALDASMQREHSPGASSGTSRKKKKVTSNKEKDFDILCIKDIILEFTAALRDGNEAIRETTRAP